MPLALIIGGSHLYGLASGLSDNDVWQVYSSHNQLPQRFVSGFAWPVGAFLRLCATGNTMAAEMFAASPDRYLVMRDAFRLDFYKESLRLVNWRMLVDRSGRLVKRKLSKAMIEQARGDNIVASKYALMAARIAASRVVFLREQRWPVLVRHDLPEVYALGQRLKEKEKDNAGCAEVLMAIVDHAVGMLHAADNLPRPELREHDEEYHEALRVKYVVGDNERGVARYSLLLPTLRVLQRKRLLAPTDVIEERMKWCMRCEHYSVTMNRCGHADARSRCAGGRGVFANARFRAAQCPLGHWGPVEDDHARRE